VAAVSGKALLIVTGIWVLAQVFAGDALGRLGIAGAGTTPKTTNSAPSGTGDIGGKVTTAAPMPTGSGLVSV
jgi:hypothetical protein